jgi:hypothetical protein
LGIIDPKLTEQELVFEASISALRASRCVTHRGSLGLGWCQQACRMAAPYTCCIVVALSNVLLIVNPCACALRLLSTSTYSGNLSRCP